MKKCRFVDGFCSNCEGELPFEFTMAFQPIVNLNTRTLHAYEALVRGVNGESAHSIISQVTADLLYRFDQACRIKALDLAEKLGMTTSLSINFLPNAVYEPRSCIHATLKLAKELGWPTERLIFEITEVEQVRDRQHLRRIVDAYREMGFFVALDDFGSGYSNLDMLIDLTPQYLKLDRDLVHDVVHDVRRQILIETTIALADRLDMNLIAEGVETQEEAQWLYERGIYLHQGFYYARPAIEALVPCDDNWFSFMANKNA
ncbi:EAL domain-containing protein [Phytohalomonas tamaricis]|uniref:EAL domain-containing protein n=1 Tax=Phytohalomonas tamaricis TaxID=2081032 RepID=UPI000D0B887E|nr:EAL domain-containing protein [Phytohalomonas tamaricis]